MPGGGYAEVGLDDGDVNMFAVLETLRGVGFNGGLQMDHLPHYDDDDGQRSATAFAVGYTKALLRALDGVASFAPKTT